MELVPTSMNAEEFSVVFDLKGLDGFGNGF